MPDARKLWIDGPAGRLEATLRVACGARAVAVIAHPHPLHGGTMHNPVVYHADRALHRAGFSTLRFNFRGVEASDGAHDDGKGEVDDVGAAVRWLRGLVCDRPLLLVGYSFGSWCGIRYATGDSKVRGVVAIGLPVGVYPIPEAERLGRPFHVVQGTADELGSLEEVRQLLARCSPPGQLLTVPGASHLFPGQTSEAGERVAQAAEAILEAGGAPGIR